ncbi:hypothetical protein MRB53_007539 [Persea americana]|uniref:Uncharacterized protein n=1 Tax=Persea americana TaxID=3435 RepID=A0ACC2MJ57_PERAE|nr:hypothetical protein MRB53_007539 [Persea americana]
MVAEGLHKQPLEAISKRIAEMKFNCVRLTWALFMVTNSTLGSVTFRQSLQNHGLVDTIKGVEVNNPALVDLPVIQVFQEVVSKLGDNNVMVILDNHLSKPGWCCSNNDGNGFFGDQYFDPQLWTSGLAKMASMFSSSTNVVAMSLRNEPRGPRQNTGDWYRYMKEGAESVHSANPNVLVIISGLSYASDLSFLSQKQLDLTFKGKLVYELHSYSWYRGSPDEACSKYVQDVMRGGGFLLDQGWPLFISEFGADERGTNANDNNFLNCFLGLAAERDLDWALWTLQGSYYLRQGVIGMEEFYGVLDSSWGQLRNASILQRLSAIQPATQEGLDRQPLDAISKRIAEMKFNCVRLTRVLFMVTDSTLGSVRFRQPLQNHGLVDTIKGVEVNNPGLVDLPEVVSKLGDDNVMVILDNHLSKPGW